MSTYINIQSTGSWSTFLRKRKVLVEFEPQHTVSFIEKKEYIRKYTEEKKKKLQSVVGFELSTKKKRKESHQWGLNPHSVIINIYIMYEY